MPEYIFTGRLTLDGVTFFIEAPSLDEARSMARLGDHADWEAGGASATNWEIDPSGGELNE